MLESNPNLLSYLKKRHFYCESLPKMLLISISVRYKKNWISFLHKIHGRCDNRRVRYFNELIIEKRNIFLWTFLSSRRWYFLHLTTFHGVICHFWSSTLFSTLEYFGLHSSAIFASPVASSIFWGKLRLLPDKFPTSVQEELLFFLPKLDCQTFGYHIVFYYLTKFLSPFKRKSLFFHTGS